MHRDNDQRTTRALQIKAMCTVMIVLDMLSRRPQEQELANHKTAIFPETREGNVYSSNESAPAWMYCHDDHRGKNSTDQVPRLEL